MEFPINDDIAIQATQLFNDAIASEGLVVERAVELAQTIKSDIPNKKEYLHEFCNASSKITHMARTSIIIAVHFQHILQGGDVGQGVLNILVFVGDNRFYQVHDFCLYH